MAGSASEEFISRLEFRQFDRLAKRVGLRLGQLFWKPFDDIFLFFLLVSREAM